MAEEGKKGRHRNRRISKNGLMRYPSGRMYRKRAAYKFASKTTPKQKKPVEERMIVKQIGGEKNGETRLVAVHRMPRSFPTEAPMRKRKRTEQCFAKHPRKLRRSITPGTVLILLAGVHKGKRVVFLKQLGTGLLLVTGPYKLNGCPLRRIHQHYVIATKTKIDISNVEIPDRLNDRYFKREKKSKLLQSQGDAAIFDTKKEVYVASEERKEDQMVVDKQVMESIKDHEDSQMIRGYLRSYFELKNKQYPHNMVF